MPWKFKIMETKSEVSYEHQIILGNFLTIKCIQELPEHELVAIVSATKECTSVEDRVMESNSKAAVRGLILILPSLSANPHLRPGTA